MWSERAPLESVPAVQMASAPADGTAFEAFVRALTARAAPPFEGPDPGCSFPRFGALPRAVRIHFGAGHVEVYPTTQDPRVANATLRAFLETVGEPAAKDAGLALTLSPAEVSVPPEQRQRWLMLPRTGELEPRYFVHVPVGGEPKVSFDGWCTPPVALSGMGGHEVRFEVGELDGEEGLALVDAAIENMKNAGPELLDAATEHVYRYYRDIAECYSAEEREDWGFPEIAEPEDVWSHVQLSREPRVSASLEGNYPYLHEGVAYVSFECGCEWEPEHGLCLVFIDGRRIGRVSSYDGHPTWAHACADPSLLDVIYRERG